LLLLKGFSPRRSHIRIITREMLPNLDRDR